MNAKERYTKTMENLATTEKDFELILERLHRHRHVIRNVVSKKQAHRFELSSDFSWAFAGKIEKVLSVDENTITLLMANPKKYNEAQMYSICKLPQAWYHASVWDVASATRKEIVRAKARAYNKELNEAKKDVENKQRALSRKQSEIRFAQKELELAETSLKRFNK